ncbi:MAG: FAD-binding oxidoreductase [Candidatus Competibacteraceae bacterium]|nr:FAD-binding oxidoreductase [Candidatus Competibacteraceae bacterium]
MATTDIIIIGGGLHGCSAALHLALANCSVRVIEQSYVGRHASGVNAGGVRRLGRDLAEIPLSAASMEIWHGIEDLVHDDCGFAVSAQIKVAETEAELEQLRQRAAQVQALGFTHEEIIDQAELRHWVPAIAPHCIGGLIARGDGHANPYRTTLAFKRRAEQLGVQFHENTTVSGLQRVGESWQVETNAGAFSAPVLINCAGAWGARIAAWLGESIPLQPTALMLMVTERLQHFLDPVLGAAGRALSFKQVENGTVIIGGGYRGRAYPDTQSTTLDCRQLANNARTAFTLFPHMRNVRIVRAWAGIEGMLPDGIPVLGPALQAPNVFHAFGFCGHGFQLGPASGRVIAELVTRGQTNIPLEAFRSDRFSSS